MPVRPSCLAADLTLPYLMTSVAWNFARAKAESQSSSQSVIMPTPSASSCCHSSRMLPRKPRRRQPSHSSASVSRPLLPMSSICRQARTKPCSRCSSIVLNSCSAVAPEAERPRVALGASGHKSWKRRAAGTGARSLGGPASSEDCTQSLSSTFRRNSSSEISRRREGQWRVSCGSTLQARPLAPRCSAPLAERMMPCSSSLSAS
mmetsp:Transcript_124972/g.241030  ORF Transcript_124972/g.241030 Transcript_124972/m.241030 type:complete len:205 (+) Transcript_124972:3460-4074(+)